MVSTIDQPTRGIVFYIKLTALLRTPNSYQKGYVFDEIHFKARLFYRIPKSCTKYTVTSNGKTIIFPLFSNNKYFGMDTML